MSDLPPENAMPDAGPDAAPPAAALRQRPGFSPIWLIPIIAIGIALYLGWQALSQAGPMITVTFHTAAGLEAGRTKVTYKAVDLGTVESIRLSQHMNNVAVRIRMRREAERVLTDHAQFWVVRPRLTSGSISGLETIVSGAYIEMDPGHPGGAEQQNFVGLEEPPAVRSDQPGHAFALQAQQLGSLGQGSPLFFHDVAVGEVLGYDLSPQGGQGVTIHVFVRSPYDTFVRADTRFWNASGFSVTVGASGVQVQLASLQALLSGGVAFDTPPASLHAPPSPPDAKFDLFANEDLARAASSPDRVPFLVYFQGSVDGLAPGAPVELYGMRVGTVTSLHLEYEPTARDFRVPVNFEVEPERIALAGAQPDESSFDIVRALVARGLRAQLRTANYLTGQQVVALDFFPDVAPGTLTLQGNKLVLPVEPGDLADITKGASTFLAKLNQIPLAQIGQNLDQTLQSLHDVVGGRELHQSLVALNDTLRQMQDLVHNVNSGMTPMLRRLPGISADLQQAVTRADATLGSLGQSYGGDSDFHRNLGRLMEQLDDAARAVRQLADLLDRHPEALIRGRVPQGGGQ